MALFKSKFEWVPTGIGAQLSREDIRPGLQG